MRIIFILNLVEMQIMIYELVDLLRQDGFDVSIYDFTSCKKYNPVTKKITSMDSFFWAPFVLKFRYFRSIFKPAINRRTIQNEFNKNTVIHLQYIHPSYLKYIDDIKNTGSKLLATFWGSDYLKADDNLKKMYANLLESAVYLPCSRVICNQISIDFPHLSSKVRRVFFGGEILKIMNALTLDQKIAFKNKYKIPLDKTLVMLGYNADDAQEHDVLIDIANRIDSPKQNIHLLIPLTYGGTQAYKNSLRQLLTASDFTFTIFETKLPFEEVAILRTLSHIVLNIQKTDAFAGAISESIDGGSVLIVGDWLPYSIYEDEWGLFLLRVKREKVLSTLNEVLNNLEYWTNKAATNKGQLDKRLSWGATYPAWRELYTSLQN
jgi:hypothetical protein